MIALVSQPFSIVDNSGFVEVLNVAEPKYVVPSRKFITDKIVPEIYSELLVQLKDDLSEAKWVTCTTDIWSAEVSNELV